MVKGLSISAQDGVTWKAMLLWKAAGSDMLKRQQAMITISHTLSLVKNNFTRAEYVKSLSKLMGIGRKDLEASVKNAGENTATVIEDEDERLFKLPEGVDPAFVAEWGFYELKNGPRKTGYWFDMGRDKRPFEVSNFVVTPLFHLFSTNKEMNKRMLEIDNGFFAKTVEIQSRRMISVEGFSGDIMEEGNFLFHGARPHLIRLNDYWGDKFAICV